MKKSAISKITRDEDLKNLKNKQLDILIIGQGITGAGIALDSASRGLTTGIIDAQDLSSGTSSRSSKMVHGGLRYLLMLDFKLVREALTERDLLLSTLAPHLAKPLPFLYPLYPREWKKPEHADKFLAKFVNLVTAIGQAIWPRAIMTIGIGMYDILAKIGGRKKALPIQKHYSKGGLKKVFPDIKIDALSGAIRYYDGLVDDSRLVLTVLRTAKTFGAYIASRTQYTGILRNGSGEINGVKAIDLETGREFKIYAKKIINATGVWTETTEKLTGATGGLKVLASKGIHIVIPREKINGQYGIATMTEKSILFIIPWHRYWIIGTTDTPWKEKLKHPVPTDKDVEYLLEHVNAILNKPVTKKDIIGVYAGLRPLLQPEMKDGTSSAKVSREHTVASPEKNFIAIAGGKLTTYRVMAKDAVDFALGESLAKKWQSTTEQIPLVGADKLDEATNIAKENAKKYNLSDEQIERLLQRYGSRIVSIFKVFDQVDNSNEVIKNAFPYLRAEIIYACTNEMAMHLEDVMTNRTHINYEVSDSGVKAAGEIAEIMASILKWDTKTQKNEVKTYIDRVKAEKSALKTSTDDKASKERYKVKDVVKTLKGVD
jgi:glycerol-3-phosphate dehydrogenase